MTASPPQAPDHDPFGLAGTTFADKYRIEALVGVGGFGVVYRGQHAGFGEPIAVKCLKLPGELSESDRPKFLARLQEEGRVLHRLSKLTSGIVQALDVGAAPGPGGQWIPYLVLEWLEGRTLAQLLSERRAQGLARMPLAEALELLQPAAEALAIAHRQKVAHRDVKPENVFVTEVDGRRTVKVLDFGIAKVFTHHASFASAATQNTPSVFTPSYGAPEQFNKKRGATGPWTDVFALALIVVELLTGERALDGDDATQLYIASADPAARPTPRHHGVATSDAVEDVLATALAVDPAERHPDVEAFWRALREAAGSPVPAGAAASDVSDTGEFVHRSGLALDGELGDDHATTQVSPARTLDDRAMSAGSDTLVDRPASRSPVLAREAAATPAPHASAPRSGERRDALPSSASRSTTGDSSSASGQPWTPPPADAAQPAARRTGGLPVVPFLVGLSLAGAGALYWQLTSIGPSHGVRSTNAPGATSSAARRPVARVAASAASASAATSASAAPSASAALGAGGAGGGSTDDGSGGSGGVARPTSKEPPPGMVRIQPSGGRAFFLDRTEVSTKAYVECVMAGRCKKATRVVLTEESARAFGVQDDGEPAAPEKLAEAWEKRCNQRRGATDHPINCVGHGSAEDYCAYRAKRLPTSAEWSAALGGRKHAWGSEEPSCAHACFGLNGSCLSSTRQVTTCELGARSTDTSQEGVLDLTGNVAEWVSDEAPQGAGDGPRWRILRGASFLDEPPALDLSQERSAPPVTAYVSIGFRCAADAP